MDENRELRLAWDFVEHTGISIFLTGKAGTGKTTFLRAVKEYSSKRMIVAAPTGVAAINAGGVTLHSFFQLPLSPFVPGTTLKSRYNFGKEKRRIIRSLDMLVIDEISMVRSDLLDAVDKVLRRYRDHTRPFGGVQLLMIGDLQQLSPVVTKQEEELLSHHYSTPYFFDSKALEQISYVTIELSHVYRQQDARFVSILNRIRTGTPHEDDFKALNARYRPAFIPQRDEGYIRLTTHNRMADSYNETQLRNLPGERFTYEAKVKDDFPESNYPADKILELKPGAQVMFIKNDQSGQHRFYNGRIGRISRIDHRSIEVTCPGDDSPIEVAPQIWENTKYAINEETKEIESKVLGTFEQYPLRLAWAITIHKSQGLTFERAVIDAGQSFAPGQVYVALSRCKSLEGMVLSSPIDRNSVLNDARVTGYIEQQEHAAEKSIEQLPALKEDYYRSQLTELFDFTELYNEEQLLYRTLVEYFRSYPKLTTLHKVSIEKLKKEVMDVAYKWKSIIRNMYTSQLHEDAFLERVQRASGYFRRTIKSVVPELLEQTKMIKTKSQRVAQLMDERYKNVHISYLTKVRLLEKMEQETFTVQGYMQAKQELLIDAMEQVEPGGRVRRKRRKKVSVEPPYFSGIGIDEKNAETKEAKPQRVKGQSAKITYDLFLDGKMPALIAHERGLAISTIFSHLAGFVKEGKLTVGQVIGASKAKAVMQAMAQSDEGANAEDILRICPDDITKEEVYLVLKCKP